MMHVTGETKEYDLGLVWIDFALYQAAMESMITIPNHFKIRDIFYFSMTLKTIAIMRSI